MQYDFKNNPKEIIEELLKYHSIDDLRKILNAKARRKEPKRNTFLSIATEVYIIQKEHDSKLEWAQEQVAEKRKIALKTVKNHTDAFRRKIKEDLSKAMGNDFDPKPHVNEFIKQYMWNFNAIPSEWDFDDLSKDQFEFDYNRTLESYIKNLTAANAFTDDDSIPF